jgi:hypothetical protein
MGFFGPYEYKNSKGQKFYLHVKERGRIRVFYFSKESFEAISFMPSGFSVVENKKTGMPYLKKGGSGLMDMLLSSPPSGKSNPGKKQG